MKTILALCAVGLLAGCGVTGGSAQFKVMPVGEDSIRTATVDAQFEMAKYHLNRNNDALAIEILRRVKRDRPTDARVLNALGVAYDRMGQFSTSRRYYEAALGADPAADYVVHNLAYSLELQGLHTESRALFARASNSQDAEVRGRAIEFAAATNLDETTNMYRPVRYRSAASITRMTAKVQSLSWEVQRPASSVSISFDNSIALLSTTDDFALAGGVSKPGGVKAEWEILIAAALQDSQDREQKAPAQRNALVVVPVVSASLGREFGDPLGKLSYHKL